MLETVYSPFNDTQAAQTYISDAVCIYKRATFIYDAEAIQEIFKIAVDMYDIPLLSPKFDKSNCDIQHLHDKKNALQFAETVAPAQNDYNEYQYWIKHNQQLTQQLIHIIAAIQIQEHKGDDEFECLTQGEHERNVRTLIRYLQQKRERLFLQNTSAKRKHSMQPYDILSKHSVYAEPIILSTSSYQSECAVCIARLLGDCKANALLKDAHMQSGVAVANAINTIGLCRNDIMKTYNIFNLCRRIININFLPDAPYGPVSIEYTMLSVATKLLPDRATRYYSKFVTYISPDAYLTVEHAQHSRIAVVSVAQLHSMPFERHCRFYNYAIYFPEDLQAAIYLRFGASQIIPMLLRRLDAIQKIPAYITTDTSYQCYGDNCARKDYHVHQLTAKTQVSFNDLSVYTFFDKGVFNAIMTESSRDNDHNVYDALQELIDIYRNIHWLGVNLFHHDVSSIFPRITARFGSSVELLTTDSSAKIEALVTHLRGIIKSVHNFHSDIVECSNLTQLYDSYTQQALQSKFYMARENLRLALSMTHRSVHEYAEFMSRYHYATARQYVCIAILHSGHYECTHCQHAYSKVAQSAHTDLSKSHLHQDVAALIQDMLLLPEYSVLEVDEALKQLLEAGPCKTASEYICKELCALSVERSVAHISDHQQQRIDIQTQNVYLFQYMDAGQIPKVHLHFTEIQEKRDDATNANVAIITAAGAYLYANNA